MNFNFIYNQGPFNENPFKISISMFHAKKFVFEAINRRKDSNFMNLIEIRILIIVKRMCDI